LFDTHERWMTPHTHTLFFSTSRASRMGAALFHVVPPVEGARAHFNLAATAGAGGTHAGEGERGAANLTC